MTGVSNIPVIGQHLADYLQQFAFRSNPNLRPKGTVIEYTVEMVDELLKCKKDPIYFIENYVHVVHPDRGICLMKLYEYQKEMIEMYHTSKRSLAMTSRQLGKTTTVAAYFVWYVLFNTSKTVAIMANKQAQAFEIMDRFRLAYENLPKWMQQGIDAWNRGSVHLENGCKIFGAATSKSGIRGRSVQFLYLDEFAFVENNQAEEFFTAVYPTITAGKDTKIVITSTPNGFNHFYKFWADAEKGLNGFTYKKVLWNRHPDRDQKWYEEQRAILGELKSAQELDTEFLGSSLQLLTPATLGRLSYIKPIQEYTDNRKGLKIYQWPIKGHNYCMTVDVSRGRHLDSSAFHIVDVTEYPHRTVTTYNNAEIAPMHYAIFVHKMASHYNDAYVLVEINDVGAQVADILWNEYEYENMFWTKAGDNLGKAGSDPYPGIRTTTRTKRIGCANLKDIIEKQQLIVDDWQTIQELSTFVQAKSGTYAADEGFHDDMVMCLVLFAWLVSQPWFRDLFDKDIRNKMYLDEERRMEEELLPIFHQDGSEFIEDSPESRGMEMLLDRPLIDEDAAVWRALMNRG